jgi:hypothetical protein
MLLDLIVKLVVDYTDVRLIPRDFVSGKKYIWNKDRYQKFGEVGGILRGLGLDTKIPYGDDYESRVKKTIEFPVYECTMDLYRKDNPSLALYDVPVVVEPDYTPKMELTVTHPLFKRTLSSYSHNKQRRPADILENQRQEKFEAELKKKKISKLNPNRPRWQCVGTPENQNFVYCPETHNPEQKIVAAENARKQMERELTQPKQATVPEVILPTWRDEYSLPWNAMMYGDPNLRTPEQTLYVATYQPRSKVLMESYLQPDSVTEPGREEISDVRQKDAVARSTSQASVAQAVTKNNKSCWGGPVKTSGYDLWMAKKKADKAQLLEQRQKEWWTSQSPQVLDICKPKKKVSIWADPKSYSGRTSVTEVLKVDKVNQSEKTIPKQIESPIIKDGRQKDAVARSTTQDSVAQGVTNEQRQKEWI